MYASHYAAGDIYVDYIGTGPTDLTYKVTCILYRACQGGSTFSSPISLGVYDTCNGVQGIQPNLTADTAGNGPYQVVSALCPAFAAQNSCGQPGSTWPGFEQWIYSATVTLPYRCESWYFYFTTCCRNGQILNLSYTTSSFYIDCHVNNQFRFNINSPRFSNPPYPYMCINQLNNFANGPIDPDNDSLVTVNANPISTGPPPFVYCTYNAGYTLANPIASSTGYSVNSASGIATFTPTGVGFFVLAFVCNKYDRATKLLIGHCRRDVQVSVLACTSPPPTIDNTPTMTGSSGWVDPSTGNVVVCPGGTDSFSIGGHSSSPINNIYMKLVPPYPAGATFTVPTTGPNQQGSANPIGTFSWTPTLCDIGYHTIIIKALDSTCTAAQPILADARFAITIQVIDGIQALPKTYYTCVFSKPVTLNVSGLQSLQYQWTNFIGGSNTGITNPTSQSPSVHPQYTSQYIVHSPTLDIVAGCKTRDTVTVIVDTSTRVKITPSTPVIMCKPGLLELNANGSGTYPLTNPSCKQVYTIQPTTVLDSTDIVPQGGKLQLCSNDKYITPFGGFRSERHQYLIKAKDMLYSGMKPGTIKAITFNVAGYPAVAPLAKYYNVNIYITCTQEAKLTTTVTHMGGADLAAHYDSLIISNTGDLYLPFDSNFVVGTHRFWDWDTTKDVLLDICYSNNNPAPTYTPGVTYVSYFNTTYGGTVFLTNATGTTCGVDGTWPGSALYELPKIRFTYYYATAANFVYHWTTKSGDKLISDTTIQKPSLWIQHDSDRYYVSTQGIGGCIVKDSVSVYLDHPPAFNAYPKDTSICYGRSTLLWAVNGVKYTWFVNNVTPPASLTDGNGIVCGTCSTPLAMPTDTTTYKVVIADANNCTDTLYLKVDVVPLPKFHALTKDTTIKYGSSIRLGVSTDIYTYVWAPISTLDNPYNTNPIATPWEPTVYTVIGFNGNCSSTDTVTVNIDYSANLFVPSAFTPNHDGKNDIFRVGNVTFQKVIEFRVLNRWGNEVFEAADNHGWDGTWNGVVQDIGIYYYMIRVESLDGTMQTFQGNVTLIR